MFSWFSVSLSMLYTHIHTEWQQSETGTVAKTFQLENKSVLETLYYASSMYKWTDSTTNSPTTHSKYTPHKLMELHKISASQFEWTVLNERARSQAWPDLELLFEKKVRYTFYRQHENNIFLYSHTHTHTHRLGTTLNRKHSPLTFRWTM